MNAFAVVSDSGTLPEESSFFTSVGHPFPAVCIRTSTERPEALDKGCFIISGIDTKGLLQAVDTAVEMVKNCDNGIPVPDYVDENVSDKVVKIIQSYACGIHRAGNTYCRSWGVGILVCRTLGVHLESDERLKSICNHSVHRLGTFAVPDDGH